jgi:hypothetical protein
MKEGTTRAISLASFTQLAGMLVAVGLAVTPAQADTFEFASPPSTQTNMIYRVNTATGEVGGCYYATGGTIGMTGCYGSGEGAGPQPPGSYHLISTRMPTEGGVFRVDHVSGQMSVCYVNNNMVVCTAPAK